MEKEFNYIEQIEAYFEGRLTTAEVQAFEKEMSENKELAAEVTDFQNIQKGIDLAGMEDITATIRSVHQEMESENFFNNTTKIKSIMEKQENKSTFGIRSILSIAAGLALLVGAYFFSQNSTTTNPGQTRAELLAATTVSPDIDYANEIIEKNGSLGFAEPNKGQKDTMTMIANYYKEGKYDTAILLINQYIESYEINNDVSYLLGSSMFQSGQYAKAVKHFLPLLETETGNRKQDLQWMTALSYMKFNTPSADTNAKKMLQKLLADPGDYDTQAIKNFMDFLK